MLSLKSILCLLTVKKHFFFLLLLNQSNSRWFFLWLFFIYESLNENQTRKLQNRRTRASPCLSTVSHRCYFLRAGSQRRADSLAFDATTLTFRCWSRRSCSCEPGKSTWSFRGRSRGHGGHGSSRAAEGAGGEWWSRRSRLELELPVERWRQEPNRKSTLWRCKPAVLQSKAQIPGAAFKLVLWAVGVSCLGDAVWGAADGAWQQRTPSPSHVASWCRQQKHLDPACGCLVTLVCCDALMMTAEALQASLPLWLLLHRGHKCYHYGRRARVNVHV